MNNIETYKEKTFGWIRKWILGSQRIYDGFRIF